MDSIRKSILEDLQERVKKPSLERRTGQEEKELKEGGGVVMGMMKFTPETFMFGGSSSKTTTARSGGGTTGNNRRSRFSMVHCKSFQRMEGIDRHYAAVRRGGDDGKKQQQDHHHRQEEDEQVIIKQGKRTKRQHHNDNEQQPSKRRKMINGNVHETPTTPLADATINRTNQDTSSTTINPPRSLLPPTKIPCRRYSKRLRRMPNVHK